MLNAFASVFFNVFSTIIAGYVLTQTGSPFSVIILFQTGAVLALICVISYTGTIKKDWADLKKYKKAVLWLLFFGICDGLCWFLSLYWNGLSGHAILSRMITVILVGYGLVVLHEKLNPSQWIACSIMVGAAFLYAFQIKSTSDLLGIIVLSIQIIGYSAFTIQQKKLAGKIDPFFILLVRSSLLVLLGITLSFWASTTSIIPSELTLFLIGLSIIGGICSGFLNHYFTMKAYEDQHLAIVSTIRSASPVILFLFGVFFFNEGTSLMKNISAILMLCGTAVLLMNNFRNKNPQRPENT